jgi:signal transduction histidine kinase
VRASRLADSASGRDGILVLFSDLSRRKAVEAEMRKVDRLAALGRLSAGVAHEIRNPLAGIRTTAELLRGRLDGDEDRVRFVDVILEETERLDRIVGSLLQFARPPTPRPRPLDVRSLLDRARQLAAGKAAERGVTIRLDVPDDLPCPPGDPDQILQVILNLVLNAIEASPTGTAVRVTAGLETGVAGEAVRVAIEDRGPGVAPAVRERIFDPFFSTKPGGTGLGLSISQHIVRAHGGMLRLEDTPAGLSVALLSLPLTGVAAGAGAPGVASVKPGETSWPTS